MWLVIKSLLGKASIGNKCHLAYGGHTVNCYLLQQTEIRELHYSFIRTNHCGCLRWYQISICLCNILAKMQRRNYIPSLYTFKAIMPYRHFYYKLIHAYIYLNNSRFGHGCFRLDIYSALV